MLTEIKTATTPVPSVATGTRVMNDASTADIIIVDGISLYGRFFVVNTYPDRVYAYDTSGHFGFQYMTYSFLANTAIYAYELSPEKEASELLGMLTHIDKPTEDSTVHLNSDTRTAIRIATRRAYERLNPMTVGLSPKHGRPRISGERKK